ncbi:20S proteasome alpha subunit F [Coccomyxa subellipsoidea C-169]|uniref:Proteasome subunit alpha type n=1 Tax=Coccomyxa subellipsoidea (strain C-169) TaxID=574566 RepID=I0YTM0_COCSC|nr:20S proteasome alpha subunit F [Coccomyxa subellipsoidea C-169]EIE21739.1 20S proteasome alpha subunit F [Coccomyxa subellipsoidea C-169]|eukprot:XP_005646283.1 20S proteasome alpha subunit F [Coccomyxa subellipsoidea C-169]
MFRNQYDQDVVTWSPQGRIHQIEYAMEAVKQGSAVVGLKSTTHVVLASIKRTSAELGAFQRKIFKIDDHLGIGVSGLISDGRSISRFLRNECLSHRFVFEQPIQVARLVRDLADRAQVATQRSWKRPYGVGVLAAGHDKTGAHLFYNCPSGAYYDYKAMAIGARSQAAKTYLERNFEEFAGADVDALLQHSLKALSASVTEDELSADNTAVALVGEGTAFTILEGDALKPYLAALKADDDAPPPGEGEMAEAADAAAPAEAAAPEDGAPPAEGPAPMED